MHNYVAPDTSLLKANGVTALKFAVDNDEFTEEENTAAFGRSDNGTPRYLNLFKEGVLIKSDSFVGRSQCLHSIILSTLFKYGPEDLRFIFIDTKRNELDCYSGLPHSLTPLPISEFGQALSALHWAVAEGKRRYYLFKMMGDKGCYASNIGRYNEIVGVHKLPRIVIVLNDLEDVVRRAANAFFNVLIRILQKFRSAGIHLLIFTTSFDDRIFPNYLLQNIGTKILYRSSDEEILFISPFGKPEQIRGLCIDEQEISAVTNFIKYNNKAHFCDELIENMKDTQALKDYDIHKKLAKLCMENTRISIPLIQRNLSVDYEKAHEFLDWLADRCYISDEGEIRKVTMPLSELIEIYGDI